LNGRSSSLKKEEIDMDQKPSDQAWQQLQSHIAGFLGQALRNDLPSIEYKPRFIVPLLAAPSWYQQNNDRREMTK
jgi:hypothetical protein